MQISLSLILLSYSLSGRVCVFLCGCVYIMGERLCLFRYCCDALIMPCISSLKGKRLFVCATCWGLYFHLAWVEVFGSVLFLLRVSLRGKQRQEQRDTRRMATMSYVPRITPVNIRAALRRKFRPEKGAY